MPTRSSSSAIRASRSASDAAEAGDVAERLAAGHPAVEPRILGEVAELAAMLAGRRDRHAVDGCAAGGRPGEAGEDLERGRLAGAVRAEEAEDGAGGHVEGQVGQGLDALVVLGQAGHRDGVGHRFAPSCAACDVAGWRHPCARHRRASPARSVTSTGSKRRPGGGAGGRSAGAGGAWRARCATCVRALGLGRLAVGIAMRRPNERADGSRRCGRPGRCSPRGGTRDGSRVRGGGLCCPFMASSLLPRDPGAPDTT